MAVAGQKTHCRCALALRCWPRAARSGPNFVPPDPQLPETSLHGVTLARQLADARLPPPTDPAWWTVFRDPILTDLEHRVAAANLDVRTATIRLAESRFQRGVAAAAEFPSINGDAKYTRELYSQNGIVSLLGVLVPPGSPPPNIAPINDLQCRLRCLLGTRPLGQGPPAGRSRRRASIRPPISAAMRWSRASPNWRATTSSCAACRRRSGSPRTISRLIATSSSSRRNASSAACKTASTSKTRPRRSRASARRYRRCSNRNPNTSMRSACCWTSRPAR